MGELENMSKSIVAIAILAILAAVHGNTVREGYSWDPCGTRLDRLKPTDLTVSGALSAGSKVTATFSGNADLHVPLDSGAWQVRIYEQGVPKLTHTEFGDLTTALRFLDPKN